MITNSILAAISIWLGAFAPPPNALPLQSVAQERANYMALHNYRWHPAAQIGQPWSHGAHFEGAGWGRPDADPKRIATCMPQRRGMQLVGDAFARGLYGTYRIRLWQ